MVTKEERLRALERQVERLRRRIDRLDDVSNRYSWIRVGVFFGGLALIILVFALLNRWLGVALLALMLVAFFIVAHYHGRVDRSLSRHREWLRIKRTHIARMTLNWKALPEVPPPGAIADHPFETDLDITGPHSLHHLLNTAVSREGGLRLREWLLNRVPDIETIEQRQQLVRELTSMTLFRDKLSLHALLTRRELVEQLDGDRLLRWVNEPAPARSLQPFIWGSAALSLATLILFVLNLFLVMPQLWIFTLLISGILFFTTAHLRGDLFEDATYLRYASNALSSVFGYLESYPYGTHVHVKQVCTPFFVEQHQRPSYLFARISRIAAAAVVQRNILVRLIINVLVPWEFVGAHLLRRYKTQMAQYLPAWLDRWYELEALDSLATFAYLNPAYTLPEVLANAPDETLFHAESIGHPLIDDAKKVTNDFDLNHVGEVVIVTGSNMSGKSTFLRTLGINLVLAYAGGPVNAQLLRIQLFRLFTSIRVSDSVTDGYSYFYAEVRRLKALLLELERKSALPLFFLIDEIFRGTNNRERLIGSRSYVRALAGHFCTGVISTHDLELIKLADTLPDVVNDHFREEVLDGNMVFDYTLRPGPSPTTNALKIMRMEGLPVAESDI